jgi:heme-degrading monooxygenase HmoA
MAWQLAQLNIALPHEPLDAPRLADFVAALAPINALADAAPGFIWRMQTEDGDATAVRPFDDERLIVNLSVWESIHALADFVYGSEHLAVMRRRREWFTPLSEAYTVLWWVPSGHRPDVDEAAERLELVRTRGPSPLAFTFRTACPAPDAAPPSTAPSPTRSS